MRSGILGYVGAILAVTGLLLVLAVWALGLATPSAWLALWTVAAILPATEVAKALVNRAVTASWGRPCCRGSS